MFKEQDVQLLYIIQCLKSSGMPIKDIKNFIEWCSGGDATLELRHNLFINQKKIVEAQMEELKKTLEVINIKCDYYEKALEAGTEDIHKKEKIGNDVF